MNRGIELIPFLLHLPVDFPGLSALPPEVVYLQNCSSFGQFCVTLRGLIQPQQYCGFCPEERHRRALPFIDETRRWALLKNEYQRKDTKQMWLIVPKWHVVDLSYIGVSDWIQIGELFEKCRKLGNFSGGGLLMRFGDPHYHAGTIDHLHFNVIEPIIGGNYRPPLAKTNDKHAEDYGELLGFCKTLDERGGERWLFSSQGIAETQPKAA